MPNNDYNKYIIFYYSVTHSRYYLLEYIVSGIIMTTFSLVCDHHVMSLQAAATHHPPFLPFVHIEESIYKQQQLTIPLFAFYAYRRIYHMARMVEVLSFMALYCLQMQANQV